LWGDSERQVYALVMGARVPDLPARLQGADVRDHDCLIPGALSPEDSLRAPYLVHLKPEVEFTEWLLFKASAELGEWGVLALSPARRLVLRGHFRSLLQAKLPEGQTIDFDCMDPAVVRAVLPLFDGAGLQAFMGPVQCFVAPGAQEWTHWQLALGQVQTRQVPLSAAA